MTAQLKQIKIRFNKASTSYDKVATVQRSAAKFLVDKIFSCQNFVPQTFLDLGTGTGYIPELLIPRFCDSSFYLNDISDKMLELCKAKFSQSKRIYYLPGDMMKLNSNIYDCVTSNLALQWVNNLEEALKFLHSKAYNILAFSTLLDGTFEEWKNIINQYQTIKILNYPKVAELISLCKTLKKDGQSFECYLMDVPLFFDNAKAFMNYLKLLGASASAKALHLSNLKKLVKVEHQSLTITYKIFFGVFRKMSE
jgi:malonyl-CoA O-methyltransferase